MGLVTMFHPSWLGCGSLGALMFRTVFSLQLLLLKPQLQLWEALITLRDNELLRFLSFKVIKSHFKCDEAKILETKEHISSPVTHSDKYSECSFEIAACLRLAVVTWCSVELTRVMGLSTRFMSLKIKHQ